jgi:hypothetical protein
MIIMGLERETYDYNGPRERHVIIMGLERDM